MGMLVTDPDWTFLLVAKDFKITKVHAEDRYLSCLTLL